MDDADRLQVLPNLHKAQLCFQVLGIVIYVYYDNQLQSHLAINLVKNMNLVKSTHYGGDGRSPIRSGEHSSGSCQSVVE